jgi:hypothetical protein
MWATANEQNNKGFEVERQKGSSWETLGFVVAKGKSATYQFMDNTPLSNTSYYRLKMIDNDQTFEYSKVVSAQSDKGKTSICMYFIRSGRKNYVRNCHFLGLYGRCIKCEVLFY